MPRSAPIGLITGTGLYELDGLAGRRAEDVGTPYGPATVILGDLDGVPVVGAPGCARSRKTNIVDWVLPRLLAGDHLTRADISALGHGGLLEEAPERPMPRDRAS